KEGTAQFVLTLSVSRSKMALAQFGALGVFILLGTLVAHVGYCVAAYRLGILRPAEALLAWVAFFTALLVVAAARYALSLPRPAPAVYAILFGIPSLAVPVLGAFVNDWGSARIPVALRLACARTIENVGLLFPKVDAIVIWPRLAWVTPERPPYPSW